MFIVEYGRRKGRRFRIVPRFNPLKENTEKLSHTIGKSLAKVLFVIVIQSGLLLTFCTLHKTRVLFLFTAPSTSYDKTLSIAARVLFYLFVFVMLCVCFFRFIFFTRQYESPLKINFREK